MKQEIYGEVIRLFSKSQVKEAVSFSLIGILSTFQDGCLDIIEKSHQMVADPKSYYTANHLKKTHRIQLDFDKPSGCLKI